MDTTTIDEPVTPSGRVFVQPQLNLVVNSAIGFKNPINVEVLKKTIANCYVMKHPKFSSLLVVDKQGKEFWRKTQVHFDDHIFVHNNPKNPSIEYSNEEQDEKINAKLAFFATSPLSIDKPLWEIHIICELKCMIFRFHHALGDGTAIVSLFLASCKRCDGKDEGDDGVNEKNKKGNNNERKWRNKGFKSMLKMVWWTTLSVMEFSGRILCVKDKRTAIRGGKGVEQWPKMVATAKFSLEDMKIVKRAIPGATINDVLFGIISFGFSKYLVARSSNALQKGLKITGMAMVNLRKQPGLQEIPNLKEDDYNSARWGNQFGFVLLPVYCKNDPDPLNYVKRSKLMMDRKKQSLEAPFSYFIGKLTISLFGPKVSSKLNYRILSNTTFMISNLIGPREESSFGDGHPMTFIRPTSSSLPQAIIMHMLSYAGMANMQILVAKDIIPDPGFMAKCFEDALLEMKNAAGE